MGPLSNDPVIRQIYAVTAAEDMKGLEPGSLLKLASEGKISLCFALPSGYRIYSVPRKVLEELGHDLRSVHRISSPMLFFASRSWFAEVDPKYLVLSEHDCQRLLTEPTPEQAIFSGALGASPEFPKLVPKPRSPLCGGMPSDVFPVYTTHARGRAEGNELLMEDGERSIVGVPLQRAGLCIASDELNRAFPRRIEKKSGMAERVRRFALEAFAELDNAAQKAGMEPLDAMGMPGTKRQFAAFFHVVAKKRGQKELANKSPATLDSYLKPSPRVLRWVQGRKDNSIYGCLFPQALTEMNSYLETYRKKRGMN